MEMMMDTLAKIIRRRSELREEREQRERAHEAFMKATAAELGELAEGEALLVAGLDLVRIQRARLIIDVYGRVSDVRRASRHLGGDQSAVRANCLIEAKADLANGGDKIGREYFGVKNYDAFGDQRHDCEYGMGPRHGSIVFSIGLTRTLRDRIRTGPHLEDHEIEDALYLLSALPRIEATLSEQKAA